MISIIRKITLKSFLLSWIYFHVFRIRNRKVKSEIECRRGESLLNYRELATPLAYYPTSYIKDNTLYGTGITLQAKLKGFDFKRRHLAEHGLILGSLSPAYIDYSFSQGIVTFSNYRKNILRKGTNKPIDAIGPYIKYAESIVNDAELAKIKRKLGRVLLVFPSHSISAVEVQFDENLLIQEIEKVKNQFDTVLVCMYWKDISLKKEERYKQMGYQITTAGHSFDYYFLNRLKTIITLADYTMSNDTGTHIGYCIVMGKPHFMVQQPKEFKGLHAGAEREILSRNTEEKRTYELASMEIAENFSAFSWDISDKQRAIVSKYWGD